MKFLSAKTLVLGGSLIAFAVPSQAVVLKQKWQAGQKLVYALDLDGTANVQLPPDAPGAALFAGVPLEVPISGKGTAALDTLKVDPSGTGTIAVTVPQWKMDTQFMGQKAQWTLRDGKSQLALNGQPINVNFFPQGDGKPKAAVQISPNGQFKGIERLTDATKAAPETATPTTPGNAIDKTALFTAMLVRSLPALWPARDVKVGDTWQSNVDFPALARPAANGAPAKPLGAFDLRLEGEDTVGGKTLQRVSIKGDLDLDGKTLEAAFPATPPATTGNTKAKPQPKLDHARQTVEGTLWFDAGAGQVAKAELVLGGRAQSTTPKLNGQPGSQSWVDFTGTLNMALQSK